MSKTAMMYRPVQKVSEQVQDMVLENPNKSVQESILFMKRLTTVAISSIAYLRGIFPESAFTNRMLAGQTVYVLEGHDDIPGTRTLLKWIRTSFELVHTYHLKKLILAINKECITLEIYTFSFSYDDDAITYDLLGQVDGKEVVLEPSQRLPEDIANSVRQLVRSILAYTTTLDPLPGGCEISVKLYLDEDTPQDLFPEFFKPSTVVDELNFPIEAETLKLGKIASKFTTYAVTSKNVMNGVYSFDGENHDENNKQVEVIEQDEDSEPEEDSEDEIPCSQDPCNTCSLLSLSSQLRKSQLTGIKEPENDSNTTNLSEKLSIVSLKEKPISCICECSDPIDDTVRCVSCSTYQHKACYKMLEGHKVESHVCIKCHDPDMGKPCSVPELLNDDNAKESALYRQALVFCLDSVQVSCEAIMTHLKIKRPTAERIMQQLEADGCLEPATNRRQVREVKKDIQETLSKYFSATTTEPQLPGSPTFDISNMEIEECPSNDLTQTSPPRAKRKLSEDSVIILSGSSPPKASPPQPKRRKILTTTSSLKKFSDL